MKVTSLVLAAFTLATYTMAADPKKHPGWHVPYEDEPLPLHELPECYQTCLNENNGKMNVNIYTLPRISYCRDDFDTFFNWWRFHVGGCVKAACTSNPDGAIKRSMSWMYKLCGFPRQAGTSSGLEDWKTLPPEDLI
ncbi:hypothetical protein LX32DRAFT_647582 [Colletotrichum zoysiae]|uniref:Uncharacterized protein n=1 Tax=Colletotrichum zoysiae TaxID=1216348 RepID=A0AAD9HW43_9PEZI|nr:hypothetical protein LX32DRAFT_647582 [Colletotrichum zoysiae]